MIINQHITAECASSASNNPRTPRLTAPQGTPKQAAVPGGARGAALPGTRRPPSGNVPMRDVPVAPGALTAPGDPKSPESRPAGRDGPGRRRSYLLVASPA